MKLVKPVVWVLALLGVGLLTGSRRLALSASLWTLARARITRPIVSPSVEITKIPKKSATERSSQNK